MTLQIFTGNFNGFSNVAGVAAIILFYPKINSIASKKHFDGFRCSNY
jgi:hypothetical protein